MEAYYTVVTMKKGYSSLFVIMLLQLQVMLLLYYNNYNSVPSFVYLVSSI